jgi:hypothetical protein
MRDQRMAPPAARRRPGAPGRSKPACSPACAPTGIGSSRKATYHRPVTTRPAAATLGVVRSADAVSNRA